MATKSPLFRLGIGIPVSYDVGLLGFWPPPPGEGGGLGLGLGVFGPQISNSVTLFHVFTVLPNPVYRIYLALNAPVPPPPGGGVGDGSPPPPPGGGGVTGGGFPGGTGG